jgi:hypothetical protein
MKKSFQKGKYPGAPAMRELVRAARGLAQSSSRIEDVFWEKQLEKIIQALLRAGDDQTLHMALDRFHDVEPEVYSEILHAVEAAVECSRWIERENLEHDVLMFALPILTWSHQKDAIRYGLIPETILLNLQTLLKMLVFAKDVRITLVDYLFCPAQIQGKFYFLYDLARKLWPAEVTSQSVLHINLPEPDKIDTLSDVRFVLGAAIVPRDEPVFRWQTSSGDTRANYIFQSEEPGMNVWQAEMDKNFNDLLPGCVIRSVLPDALFAVSRTADHLIRPFSIYACIDYLSSNDIGMDELCAVIAPVFVDQYQEYRVSLIYARTGEVLQGIIWTLTAEETVGMPAISEIQSILYECGITKAIILGNLLDLEYLKEYEAILFPNLEGKMVKVSQLGNFKELSGYLH